MTGRPATRVPPAARPLQPDAWLEADGTAVHVALARDWPVLGSAVLNGGLVQARHLLNLRVDGRRPPPEAPEATLQRHARRQGWSGRVVGMMTAASLDSLRVVQARAQGVVFTVLVTCGLANLRRTGDRAEHRLTDGTPPPAGTINIQFLSGLALTPAAMAEALMMITEAKTAVLHRRGLRSPVSGLPATGTGTDAVAVACDPAGPPARYCGKHVLAGEVLGDLVMAAVDAAVESA